MNNAKIWLVVPPAVGVPLILGSVVVGSVAIHTGVLINTNWLDNYWAGDGFVAEATVGDSDVQTASAPASPFVEEGQVITVTMPDGTTVRAVVETNEVLASASPSLVIRD